MYHSLNTALCNTSDFSFGFQTRERHISLISKQTEHGNITPKHPIPCGVCLFKFFKTSPFISYSQCRRALETAERWLKSLNPSQIHHQNSQRYQHPICLLALKLSIETSDLCVSWWYDADGGVAACQLWTTNTPSSVRMQNLPKITYDNTHTHMNPLANT